MKKVWQKIKQYNRQQKTQTSWYNEQHHNLCFTCTSEFNKIYSVKKQTWKLIKSLSTVMTATLGLSVRPSLCLSLSVCLSVCLSLSLSLCYIFIPVNAFQKISDCHWFLSILQSKTTSTQRTKQQQTHKGSRQGELFKRWHLEQQKKQQQRVRYPCVPWITAIPDHDDSIRVQSQWLGIN